MGGKVVKNCAGFDLPKFFVGSLGRYGVLAEVTFKVFPMPASRLTLKLPTTRRGSRRRACSPTPPTRAGSCDALDLLPDGKTVCLRLAGPAPALEAVSREILARWPGQVLSPPKRTPPGPNSASSAGRTPAARWSKWPITPRGGCRWMPLRVRSMARASTSASEAMLRSFPCRPRCRRPPCRSACVR